MDLILNELSFEPKFESAAAARSGMGELAEALSEGVAMGLVRALRTHDQFFSLELAPNYLFLQWVNDGEVDRDTRNLVMATATKKPTIDFELRQLTGDRLCEFSVDGRAAVGLGVAHLRGEASLSVARDPWRTDPIRLRSFCIAEDGDQESDDDVCNIFSENCWARRHSWFEERAVEFVQNGEDILVDRNGLFSGLSFCERARKQLEELKGSEPEFHSVVRHLLALASRARSWSDGRFAQGLSISFSVESESTLDQFGDQREFPCPDGVTRQFTLHSKIGIGARRIYFLAVSPGTSVLIGYVGRHLDVVTG